MTYMLVLQFPSRSVDFEALVALEESLRAEIPDEHNIDGHDFGSGEGNIFIITSQPRQAFQLAKVVIDREGQQGLRAAFRPSTGDDYTILWPPGLGEFIVT